MEKYLVYRMQNMVSVQQADAHKSGLYQLVLNIIELGQESGEIRTDLPFTILEDLVEFAFIEVVKQLYLEAEEAIDRCVDLFLNGAAPRHR